jgi:hypothetical protein
MGRLDLADGLHSPGLSPARGPDAGRWVIEATTGPWYQVGSLMPEGFAAYVRIFHPAYRRASACTQRREGLAALAQPEEVSWAEVAEANGRVAHPTMQWEAITGSERYVHRNNQPGIWDEEPREGTLPVTQGKALVATLETCTGTADRCWFSVWEGYGHIALPREAARLPMPNRQMVMFSGPIGGWVATQSDDPLEQSPSLWWPEDRAWCVATGVDQMTTYVGASESCARRLLGAAGLEAHPASLEDSTISEGDTINPRPTP